MQTSFSMLFLVAIVLMVLLGIVIAVVAMVLTMNKRRED